MRHGLSASLVVLLCLALGLTGLRAAESDDDRQRLLPLSGALNARDLGGYTTTDGRSVRWGVLFRADSLAGLTDSDVAVLRELDLAAVTDFRGEAERAGAPDRLPEQTPPIAYRTIALNDPAVNVAELGRKVYAGELTEAELLALGDRRVYVEDERLRKAWGAWVASLAKPGAMPHLFHCTAGKDRTGYAAALLLLVLGVPEDQVMDDFLLSNDLLAAKVDAGVSRIQAASDNPPDTEVLRQVLGVSPRSLEGAIDAMIENYGSVDEFIERGLGIDAAMRTRLQDLLLE